MTKRLAVRNLTEHVLPPVGQKARGEELPSRNISGELIKMASAVLRLGRSAESEGLMSATAGALLGAGNNINKSMLTGTASHGEYFP